MKHFLLIISTMQLITCLATGSNNSEQVDEVQELPRFNTTGLWRVPQFDVDIIGSLGATRSDNLNEVAAGKADVEPEWVQPASSDKDKVHTEHVASVVKDYVTTKRAEVEKIAVTRAPQPPPPAPVPVEGDARRTRGTEAPMLGYIFDTHASVNKHHHHDHKWGPHFEEAMVSNSTNMTVQVASTAVLNCRISLLQDKTVSWVRRGSNSELQLLTVGRDTYSGDPRYQIDFQYPNNWRLQIQETKKHDEGVYECQISTYPPKVIRINLHINAPEVVIIDEKGRQLHDKYYEVDSTIQLTCIVRHVTMTSSVVWWSHGDVILNTDTSRGGISVRTDLTDEGANSGLSVARINKTDGGNYTCSISPKEFATVNVHVLNGESIAELHDGSGCDSYMSLLVTLLCLLMALTLS